MRVRDANAGGASGFTLLEMMVVMTLIGILLGIGVGFLQRRGDELDIATSVVRDSIRVAALTARTRHVPTEVRLDVGDGERPASVVASVPQLVGQWHMEEGVAIDDVGGLRSEVGGIAEPGRFGFARRHDLTRNVPLLDVPTEGRPVFDLRDGFALRIDVKLDVAEPMTIARLGTSLELELDAYLVPSLRVVGTEGGDRAGPAVRLRGVRPLRTRRWHTLTIVCDGRHAQLLVDAQRVDSVEFALPILQTDEDRFQVSPSDAPVIGLVDEILLEAYDRGEVQYLPFNVQLRAEPRVIAFDRNGDLVDPARFELAIGEDRREFSVGPGGVVE